MSNAIEVSGAGKRYTKYDDSPMLITSALHFRARTQRNKLWALRGVDIEVPKGSTFGLDRTQRVRKDDPHVHDGRDHGAL